jgi:hypothetical protein
MRLKNQGRVGEGLRKKKKKVGVDYKYMDRKMDQKLQLISDQE